MSKKASSITSRNSDSNALNGLKKRQSHLICNWLPLSSFHHQFLESARTGLDIRNITPWAAKNRTRTRTRTRPSNSNSVLGLSSQRCIVWRSASQRDGEACITVSEFESEFEFR